MERKSVKRKVFQKIASCLLTAALFCSMMPTVALAEGTTECNGTDCTCEAAVVAGDTTTHYDTLEEAVSGAPENATVQLLRDVMLSEQLVINKTITLDGTNGNTCSTITGTSCRGNGAILVTKNGVTLQNLVVSGPNSNPDGWDPGEYGIKVYCASDVTLENVTVSGANAGVLVSSSDVALKGTITVSGNEFGGIEVSRASASEVPGSLNIVEGATVVCGDENTPAIWVDKAAEGEGTVSIGGQELPALYVNADSKDQIYYVTNQMVIDNFVATAGGTIVANSNGIQFTSLPDAVALAKDGDTITIQDNSITTVTKPVDKMITFKKAGEGALDFVTFGNNGYPYGTQLSGNNAVLAIDVTGTANTYQWQSAEEKNGSYSDIDGKTTSTLAFSPTDKTWYRCLVNGVPSNGVELLSISNDDMMDDCEVLNINYSNCWYISNGTMAYTIVRNSLGLYTNFAVLGKYTKTTDSGSTTYWLNTTYDDGWQLFTSEASQPNSPSEYTNDGNAKLDAFRVSFDMADANALHMEADLAAGQRAFAFGADVMLGDDPVTEYADYASLKAIYKDGKVSSIQMVGAASIETAAETDPAFVLRLARQTPSCYWLGKYSSRTLWENHESQQMTVDSYIAWKTDGDYTTFEEYFEYVKEAMMADFKAYYKGNHPEATDQEIQAKLDAYIESKGGWIAIRTEKYNDIEKRVQGYNNGYSFTDGVVSEVKGIDSGMTVSWMNLSEGGTVQFDFCIGSVKETGAEITVNAQPDTNSITVINSKKEIYYVVFDKSGNPISDWIQGNGGALVFDQNIRPGTNYVIQAVKAVDFDTAQKQPRPGAEIVETEVTTAGGSNESSGGSKTYAISVEKEANGTVLSSRSHASGGAAVKLTVTPDKGYLLDGVTVTDAKGNAVELTKNSDGTYSFKMPRSKVTVSAVFKIAAEGCEDGETCPAHRFADLDLSEWYHDGIHYCVEKGLMKGTDDTTFTPYGTTTRGMVAAILYRIEKEPGVEGDCPFTDVESGFYYEDAITWAAANGIVTGYSDSQYGPEDAITREQMAAILYRYAQYKGMDAVTPAENLSSFADADSISEYAVSAMNWAVGAALIKGDGNQLMPAGNAERCQVAAILTRFCENVVK